MQIFSGNVFVRAHLLPKEDFNCTNLNFHYEETDRPTRTHLCPDAWKDEEEGGVEGAEGDAHCDCGDVAKHGRAIAVRIQRGAAVLPEHVEPPPHPNFIYFLTT